MLAEENIGKFGELMAIHFQFYRNFDLRIYLEETIHQSFLPQII